MILATLVTFQLCFNTLHGRCFQTVPATNDAVTLQQSGGRSDSAAKIPKTKATELQKEVAALFSSTAYAGVTKATPAKKQICQKSLRFRIFDESKSEKLPVESERCVEKLMPRDGTRLFELTTRLSNASKP